jgi:hypothetical protein
MNTYGVKKITLNMDMSPVRKRGSKIEAAVNSVGGGKMDYRYGVMKTGSGLLDRQNKKNYRHFNLDFD